MRCGACSAPAGCDARPPFTSCPVLALLRASNTTMQHLARVFHVILLLAVLLTGTVCHQDGLAIVSACDGAQTWRGLIRLFGEPQGC